MKKLIIITIILLYLLTLGGCSKTTSIELSDYADIKISGYDGKGKASLNINWGDFENAIFTKEELNSLSSLSKASELENSIKYSLDKTEGLFNGDKVTLNITWDKDVAKKHNLKFSSAKREITVTGLEKLTEVDLFADIYVEFEGVSPEAKAIIRNTSNDAFLKTVSYNADNSFNLSNGDKIIVTAGVTPEAAENKGYSINETKREYTVSGIDEYITSYSTIDSDTLSRMDKQSRDVIDSEIASSLHYRATLYPGSFSFSNYYNSIDIKEINLIHSYFFKLKDGISKSYSDVSNSIFMVYEVTFTTSLTAPNETDTVYLPIYYKSIIKRSDGTIDLVITDARITSAKSNSWDNMYRDTVTVNKAKYDYEEISY